MKPLTATLFTAVLASASIVSAKETPDTARPVIVVQGRGVAQKAPDAFFIGGEIRGEGRDSVEALRALTATQARITDGLTDMEGLTRGAIRTDAVSVEPLFAADCVPNRRESDACPVSGFTARMRFQFKGSPAASAG
ncbi:MAG TPA: SIMPL domain-containing protein, partial [Brevundimonas sp.]|nr:SIMPL domain-containing protein [Brevundimonas sp.]